MTISQHDSVLHAFSVPDWSEMSKGVSSSRDSYLDQRLLSEWFLVRYRHGMGELILLLFRIISSYWFE